MFVGTILVLSAVSYSSRYWKSVMGHGLLITKIRERPSNRWKRWRDIFAFAEKQQPDAAAEASTVDLNKELEGGTRAPGGEVFIQYRG